MEGSSAQSATKFKMGKRPDSMKIELLTIPENSTSVGSSLVKGAVNVGFRNLSYTVREGLIKRKPRILLDNVNGDFAGGELTAIMGPSGCGKTTLMNILAGYTTYRVNGTKLVNDSVRNEKLFRKRSCYIMQDDRLEPLLTIAEALALAAHLRLPNSYTDKERRTKVKQIMESVTLWEHRKTMARNLSGGQKKRLSIALEMLKNPQVMFFDEPTSGLDSLASRQCVNLLKQLALTGRTIVCTIHQPSASLFEIFDHLYVLAKGKCLYQGSVKGLVPYLEEVNLRCPTYHNPADFLLEVASGEYGDHTNMLSIKSENGMNQDWRKTQRHSIIAEDVSPNESIFTTMVKIPDCDRIEDLSYHCCQGNYPTSYFNQTFVLLKRTYLVTYRDKTLTYSRLITHSSIALFLGFLYYGIGIDASNILNNFNFMFFTVMFLMMTAFNCITTTFPSELPIISKEHFNKWYSLKSYYIAKTLADVPIQMCATLIYGLVTYFLTKQPLEGYRVTLYVCMCMLISLVAQSFGLVVGATMDIKNGVIFGPFCFLPFTIFSGFFVQLNDSHPYLRWVFHISYLKYGFEGLVLSVLGYERDRLPCNADYCHYVYPEKFLLDMDMDNASYNVAVYFLISVFFFARILAYFALKLQIIMSRQKI